MPLRHVARPAVRSAAVAATLAAGAAHAQSPAGTLPAGTLPANGRAAGAAPSAYRLDLFGLTPAAVPEPASAGLVVAGLLATVGATERRRREVAA